VEQGSGEVVEGALAAVTPVACASRALLVRAPAANTVALAARTWQRTVFPPERMEGGLTLVNVEELVDVRKHRHGGESPGVAKQVLQRIGDSHMFMMFLRSYKWREIERVSLYFAQRSASI
jgi:hypothetical protein